MTRFQATFTALATAAFLSTAAMAGEPVASPDYLGERSNNPEQETYATITVESGDRALPFVGPAQSFGTVTGDPEKDTVAYKPFPADILLSDQGQE